jgi:hypothetical protein
MNHVTKTRALLKLLFLFIITIIIIIVAWIGGWQRPRHLFSPDCSPSSHRMFSLGIKGLASAFYLHHHLFVFFCTVCSTSPGPFLFCWIYIWPGSYIEK